MGKQITDYLLYQRRYLLGYATIGITVIGLLLLAGLFIPGGISQSEMQSVVSSSAFHLSFSSFDPSSIVNLPYKILQRGSLDLLGISNFSIKLPSLLLAAFSILGILILLKSWFRQNVAVITMALVITTGQFLFVAQNGTPGIVYIFWSIWILVAATMVSRAARFITLWKIALFGLGALSLYTPLSTYIILALVSAAILHPHLRYLLRKLSKPKLLLAGLCALIIIAPLIYAIVRQPSLSLTLLGIPQNTPNLTANFIQLIKQYFDFITPNSGVLMTPVYGLGSMILILLGILRLFTTKYTARSYIISAWVILLLPILLISPTFSSVSFVPIMLLMAMGIAALVHNWYRLFPRNPYARIVGLIPLAILIGGMVTSGFDRYVYGYLYDPNIAINFSQDLTLINTELKSDSKLSTIIVVSASEQPFYNVVAAHHKNVVVQTTLPNASQVTILTRSTYKATVPPIIPTHILTDDKSDNADRFYIYKSDTK
jgi:hypothetical protein